MVGDFKLHIPVLLNEVIQALKLEDGGVYVDATFGAGGYAKAILEQTGTSVIGIDRDPLALELAVDLQEKYGSRLALYNFRFSQMAAAVDKKVDGIVFDLGVSSMQIDDAKRGFSFQKDGPLDMRMEQNGQSAADAINTLPEQKLADIIHSYGQERYALKIAKAIVKRRNKKRFSTTLELAELVESIVPRAKDGMHPATRTFQAVRIYVNDELEEIRKALCVAASLLKPKGKLVVVTFHSLEDKIVKTFMQDKAGKVPAENRYVPVSGQRLPVNFVIVNKKPITPSSEEIYENPRSRSAKMRVLERKETNHG